MVSGSSVVTQLSDAHRAINKTTIEVEENSINYKDTIIQSMYLHEGIKYESYSCSAGKTTIGCGHIILPTDVNFGRRITHKQLDSLLVSDINKAERLFIYNTPVRVRLRLSNCQTYAIIKFIFHCGIGNYNKSTFKRLIIANSNQRWININWLKWSYHHSSTGELIHSEWQYSIRQYEVNLFNN